MPLDHYVSQTHLKNFYSLTPPNLLYAIKKSDLKRFRCNSKSVCRIEGGSTNIYLTDERAIEEFLRDVEPKYNPSITKLRDDKIDQECIYSIAGFISYVACCAPAAMRIQTGPLQSTLQSSAEILEKRGLIPTAPPALGSKSLSELLADGTVNIAVDQKYPQAIGISSIIEFVSIFGNSTWEILQNNISDSPFFTSDFPTAIEAAGPNRALNKIVPLAPDLAVRIIPNVGLSGASPDLSFTKLKYRRRTLRRDEVRAVNRLVVQCAEETVFYRDSHEWIEKFIEKNRSYRVEAVTDRIPVENGFMNISQQRIVSTRSNGRTN